MTVEEANLSDLSTATYQAAINNIQGFLKYLQTNDECGLAETGEALYLSTESRMKRLHRSGKNRVVEEVAVVDDIGIFSSLVLPCDGIDLDWVFEVLIPYLSTGQEVELSTAEIIVACAHDRFSCEPLLVDMNFSMEDDDLILVGDIHGQFRDLLQIFEHYGRPSERRRYLFNGDIVDRGPRSMACWLLLCAMKVAAPDRIFVTRGNHESKTVSVLTSSFAVECVNMYSEDCFDACHRVFDQLPVAYIINSSIFVNDIIILVVINSLCISLSLSPFFTLLLGYARWTSRFDRFGLSPYFKQILSV